MYAKSKSGIYGIVNIITHKIYIGQTSNFNKRFKEHYNNLVANRHVNHHLQNAWNKYGSENFIFIIIEFCENNVNLLTKREQYWIDYYGGIGSSNTYNNRDAGNRGTFSESSREKLRKASMGRKVSDDVKQHLHEINIGRKHTPEAIEKIRQASMGRPGAMLGKHLSDETKKKISDKLKGRPAHNKGVPHTEEAKRKIGEASRNRPRRKWTEEEKRAMSEKNKGRIPWNKGMSMPYKGKKLPKEQVEHLRNVMTQQRGYSVAQYDLSGNLLNTFISTMDADRQTGVCNAGISACCRGLQKTAGGYIWKKLDD